MSLKPQHFHAALAAAADGLWFEVHPENYMVAGGPRLAWLDSIRERHPLALHGVALSLAADADPDVAHLKRLNELARRSEPAIISEHLAWSTWRGVYFPDLLPFPRTSASLQRCAANISRTQDTLGRRIAVENPSHYLTIDAHEWDEADFLGELVRRTGCGLLLDINNVYVSAHNLGYCAARYVDSFPLHAVMEIHLAGHSRDAKLGDALLVDSHDAPIATGVWTLYERVLLRAGPRPTLIERDDNVPEFGALLAERGRAHELLAAPSAVAA